MGSKRVGHDRATEQQQQVRYPSAFCKLLALESPRQAKSIYDGKAPNTGSLEEGANWEEEVFWGDELFCIMMTGLSWWSSG